MFNIFEPSLRAIYTLVAKQIRTAIDKDTDIDRVVLVGGFGDSPALKEHLKSKIQELNDEYNTNIRLITTPP
jgi:molecular chaperone DnaK (HSP70)